MRQASCHVAAVRRERNTHVQFNAIRSEQEASDAQKYAYRYLNCYKMLAREIFRLVPLFTLALSLPALLGALPEAPCVPAKLCVKRLSRPRPAIFEPALKVDLSSLKRSSKGGAL